MPLGKRPRGIRREPRRHARSTSRSAARRSRRRAWTRRRCRRPTARRTASAWWTCASASSLKVIPAGTDPEQLAVSRDGSRLFVANEDAAHGQRGGRRRRRAVVATRAGGRRARRRRPAPGRRGRVRHVRGGRRGVRHRHGRAAVVAREFAVDPRPRSTAFLPDGSRAYVTCENGGSVVGGRRAEARACCRRSSSPARWSGRWARWPRRTAGHVYVTTGRGKNGRGHRHRRPTRRPGRSRSGTRPWGIAVSPDGRTLYTANGPSNDVSIVDVASARGDGARAGGRQPLGCGDRSLDALSP